MDLLITGFTAWGRFSVNPAESIARRVAANLGVGVGFEAVEVSYQAVEELVARLAADPPAVWVMLGVAGKANRIRLERVARNRVGSLADVRGIVRGPGVIDAEGPAELVGGLFVDDAILAAGGSEVVWSDDAGEYLCNFMYWLGRTRLPTRCGFVHVAPVEELGEDRQVEVVTRVIREAQRASLSPTAAAPNPVS